MANSKLETVESSTIKVTFPSSLQWFAAYVLFGWYVLILSRYCKMLLSLHWAFPAWDVFYCSYSSISKTLFSNMNTYIMQSRISRVNKLTTVKFILWRRPGMSKMSCTLWVYQILMYSCYLMCKSWLCSMCSVRLMNLKQVEKVHPPETSIFVDILLLWEAVHAIYVVEYYEIRGYILEKNNIVHNILSSSVCISVTGWQEHMSMVL